MKLLYNLRHLKRFPCVGNRHKTNITFIFSRTSSASASITATGLTVIDCLFKFSSKTSNVKPCCKRKVKGVLLEKMMPVWLHYVALIMNHHIMSKMHVQRTYKELRYLSTQICKVKSGRIQTPYLRSYPGQILSHS